MKLNHQHKLTRFFLDVWILPFREELLGFLLLELHNIWIVNDTLYLMGLFGHIIRYKILLVNKYFLLSSFFYYVRTVLKWCLFRLCGHI